MPYRLNPFTGNWDFFQSAASGGAATSAAKIQVTRVANEDILAGELVKSDSPTNVSLASANGTSASATVLGVAATDVTTGNNVEIVLFGAFSDASYVVFTVNSPLFLDVNGDITDTKRTTGYHTIIGKSLGGTEIFLEIQPPIKL